MVSFYLFIFPLEKTTIHHPEIEKNTCWPYLDVPTGCGLLEEPPAATVVCSSHWPAMTSRTWRSEEGQARLRPDPHATITSALRPRLKAMFVRLFTTGLFLQDLQSTCISIIPIFLNEYLLSAIHFTLLANLINLRRLNSPPHCCCINSFIPSQPYGAEYSHFFVTFHSSSRFEMCSVQIPSCWLTSD